MREEAVLAARSEAAEAREEAELLKEEIERQGSRLREEVREAQAQSASAALKSQLLQQQLESVQAASMAASEATSAVVEREILTVTKAAEASAAEGMAEAERLRRQLTRAREEAESNLGETSRLRAALRSCTGERDEARAARATVELESREVRAEVGLARAEAREDRIANDRLRVDMRVMATELGLVEGGVRELSLGQQSADKAAEGHQATVTMYKEENRRLREELRRPHERVLNGRTAEGEAEVDTMARLLQTSEQQAATAAEEARRLQAELSRAHEDADSAHDVTINLRSMLGEAEQRASISEAALVQLQGESRQLACEKASAESEVRALAAELAASREQVLHAHALVTTTADSAKQELEHAQALTAARAEGESIALRQVKQLRAEVGRVEAEVAEARGESARLEKALRIRSGKLSTELINAQEEGGMRRTEALELRKRLNALEAASSTVQAELGQRTSALEVAQQAASAAEEAKRKAEGAAREANAQHTELARRHHALSERAAKAEVELEAMRSSHTHSLAEVSNLREEAERAVEAAGIAALERQQMRAQLETLTAARDATLHTAAAHTAATLQTPTMSPRNAGSAAQADTADYAVNYALDGNELQELRAANQMLEETHAVMEQMADAKRQGEAREQELSQQFARYVELTEAELQQVRADAARGADVRI